MAGRRVKAALLSHRRRFRDLLKALTRGDLESMIRDAQEAMDLSLTREEREAAHFMKSAVLREHRKRKFPVNTKKRCRRYDPERAYRERRKQQRRKYFALLGAPSTSPAPFARFSARDGDHAILARTMQFTFLTRNTGNSEDEAALDAWNTDESFD